MKRLMRASASLLHSKFMGPEPMSSHGLLLGACAELWYVPEACSGVGSVLGQPAAGLGFCRAALAARCQALKLGAMHSPQRVLTWVV